MHKVIWAMMFLQKSLKTEARAERDLFRVQLRACGTVFCRKRGVVSGCQEFLQEHVGGDDRNAVPFGKIEKM